MATVDEIVKTLLGSVDTETDVLLAIQWLNDRYKELVSRVRFNHLRRVGELRTAAMVDTGSITIARDSKAVTGGSTTWATSPGVFATTTQPYWALRGATAWYEVDYVTSNTALRLVTAFSEASLSSASYKLAKRYHILDSSARWLGQFVHPRHGVLLGEPISQHELDSIDPRRSVTGSPPGYVSLVGTTKTGNTDGVGTLMVEIYPYSEEAELLQYVYWDIPSAFGMGDTIPPQIDDYILKEGAYIDYCRFMMAKREKEGKLEATTFWRNEMHAAKTKWEHMIAQAARTDRAVDDASFILERSGASNYGLGVVKTARGHWLSSYSRP